MFNFSFVFILLAIGISQFITDIIKTIRKYAFEEFEQTRKILQKPNISNQEAAESLGKIFIVLQDKLRYLPTSRRERIQQFVFKKLGIVVEQAKTLHAKSLQDSERHYQYSIEETAPQDPTRQRLKKLLIIGSLILPTHLAMVFMLRDIINMVHIYIIDMLLLIGIWYGSSSK